MAEQRHGDVTPGCKVGTESIFIDYNQLTKTQIPTLTDYLTRRLEETQSGINKSVWITSASPISDYSVFKKTWDESIARLRSEPDYLKESERYAKYIQSGLYPDHRPMSTSEYIANFYKNDLRKEPKTMNDIYVIYKGLTYRPDSCDLELHCGDAYPEVSISARLDPVHACSRTPRFTPTPKFTPKEVIHNNPATIVYWNDGTKTVVKSENEAYDPEKGLAMAYVKKYEGNKGNYYNFFRKHLPDGYETINYKGLYEELVNEANHKSSCSEKAYAALLKVAGDKKALKTDLQVAIEEALGYLGEALED